MIVRFNIYICLVNARTDLSPYSYADVWTAVRCTAPRPDDSQRPLVNGDFTPAITRDKETVILELAFQTPTG